jgi:hypothetical protein
MPEEPLASDEGAVAVAAVADGGPRWRGPAVAGPGAREALVEGPWFDDTPVESLVEPADPVLSA